MARGRTKMVHSSVELQSAVEVHLIVLCARSQVMEKPRSVRSPKTKQQQMGFIDYRTENKCYHDETGL